MMLPSRLARYMADSVRIRDTATLHWIWKNCFLTVCCVVWPRFECTCFEIEESVAICRSDLFHFLTMNGDYCTDVALDMGLPIGTETVVFE